MSGVKKTAVTVLSAALLPLLAAAPSWAGPRADAANAKPPQPPAHMSDVGGARLGLAGTQVGTGTGVPALPKELTGRSWIVSDAQTGDVLAAHNAHWRLPPASTLKMLFADTLLPKLPSTEQHRVAAADLQGMGAGSSLVGVKENETYSVRDLWLGVFLRSGNDAVHVLAAMNGGVAGTVRDMQRHADDLQALDTHVVSPDGYDMPGQVSSAYDLSLFARSGLQKKDFRQYCSTATAQFPGDQKKGKKRATFQIQNTDRLLTGANGMTPYPGLAGVKNGYTTNAGNTYTGVAEDAKGRVVLVTVMNPSSKEANAVYKEAASLLNWGFAADGKVTPVGKLVPPKSAATDTKQAGASKSPSAGDRSARPAVATASQDSSHVGATALAIIGGVLVVLAAGGYVVNRRWPRHPRA
ncbi:D-alanyl-D-alanine carboxypeptidase family protein [Streptomyces fuscigenes]|uniref:D-alanyl-D-alanine carboxypeptidase family protein n=1 Tax=Streptomyces fuscigenes TaxID=1528880 RepID=UPI00355842BB